MKVVEEEQNNGELCRVLVDEICAVRVSTNLLGTVVSSPECQLTETRSGHYYYYYHHHQQQQPPTHPTYLCMVE
jgi:hypothetical protein